MQTKTRKEYTARINEKIAAKTSGKSEKVKSNYSAPKS